MNVVSVSYLSILKLLLVWSFMLSSYASEAASAANIKVGETFRDCEQCPLMVRVPPNNSVSVDHAAVYEITYKDYLPALKDGSCPAPNVSLFLFDEKARLQDTRKAEIGDPVYDTDFPISRVGLEIFDCFIGWLRKVTGKDYRQPTGQEWLWVAYGGAKTRYPWGDDAGYNLATIRGAFDYIVPATGVVIKTEDVKYSYQTIAEGVVGRFPPNKFGLYDVIGNQMEISIACNSPHDDRQLPLGWECWTRDVYGYGSALLWRSSPDADPKIPLKYAIPDRKDRQRGTIRLVR